jgi:competence protein ComEA
MRHHNSIWLLAGAVGVLAVSVATAARVRSNQATKPNPPSKPQTNQTPVAGVQSEQQLARTGEQLVKKVCDSACHGLEKLDEMRRTGRDWNDQVAEMVTKGATATSAQLATIKKYLTRYYGLVPVNTATAQELSAVLGFSAKDAQAIVAYRTAHGKFADADALSKVPGIDKSRIEAQPDALVFK